jgi:hypothetical protein
MKVSGSHQGPEAWGLCVVPDVSFNIRRNEGLDSTVGCEQAIESAAGAAEGRSRPWGGTHLRDLVRDGRRARVPGAEARRALSPSDP